MYGTLRGALAGRKIEYDRQSYKATVEGRISGIGKTIRITSIHVHYDLTVPHEAREATERALAAHPQGCPAHQSVKDAIRITWSATLKAGEEIRSCSTVSGNPPAVLTCRRRSSGIRSNHCGCSFTATPLAFNSSASSANVTAAVT